MHREVSKTQIDRLGDRLKKGEADEGDLRLLSEYLGTFAEASELIVGLLRSKLRVNPSVRQPKSIASIVDKLRRERTRLSSMQDLVGCRVVVATIVDQNILVENINALFSDRDIFSDLSAKDRRAAPSHGYRAFHFVVTLNDRKVEIQVRSELQHVWAERSEKMADAFREIAIKYGGGPENVKRLLAKLSQMIAKVEDLELYVHDKVGRVPAPAFLDIETVRDMDDVRTRAVKLRRYLLQSLDQELGDLGKASNDISNRI